MTALTARQREALEVIGRHITTHGRPPTLREIGAEMGIHSTNGIADHTVALERKGFLRRTELKARGLQLTDQGRALLGMGPPGEVRPTAFGETVAIPILGRITRATDLGAHIAAANEEVTTEPDSVAESGFTREADGVLRWREIAARRRETAS